MINSVVIEGRLTRPPEVKQFKKKDGTSSLAMSFSIASDIGYGDFKHTSFFDCKMFGNVDKTSQLMYKGQKVLVDGQLKQERWEKDGQKFSKIIVSVKEISLQEFKPKDGIEHIEVPIDDYPIDIIQSDEDIF
jgi:single-strand DNA-binding protein